MRKISSFSIIGILFLGISLMSQSTSALYQDVVVPEEPQTSCLDQWIKGENIAYYKNGGTISNFYNCDENGIVDNDVIDENSQSFVQMNAPACAFDSYIEIDFDDGYHRLYEIKIKLSHQSYDSMGHVKISIHVDDGSWKTIYENKDVAIGQTLNLLIEDNVYLENADKIKIKTYGNTLTRWKAYELRVYEAVEGPKATFLCPDENLPINTVYFLNKPVFQIPILFPCSVLVKSQLHVNFKADLLIKYVGVSRGNTMIYEEYFTESNAKSEIGKFFSVSDGAYPYTITVKDFKENSKTYTLNLLGVQNGPAFALSKPLGPNSGVTKKTYTYSVNAVDLEGDAIEYGWDWNGDGSVDQWTSRNTISHSWKSAGNYEVIVSVKEANSGRLGLWTTSKTIKITEQGLSNDLSTPTSQIAPITPIVPITPTSDITSSSEVTQISIPSTATVSSLLL